MCAGLYYGLSDFQKEAGGHQDDIRVASELGNGWTMAAHWIFANAMTDGEAAKAYVNERVSGDRALWRSRLRGMYNPAVVEWLNKCKQLSPLQAFAVGEIRRKC